MRRLLLALAFLGWAAAAQAQTDPCAGTPATSGTATTGQPVVIQFCAPTLDQNGGPVTPLTGAALYINTVRTTPAFVAGATTTSGKTLWTLATFAPSSTGVATYQVAAIDNKSREGLKSDPFALTVSLPDAAPGKPTNLTVKAQ